MLFDNNVPKKRTMAIIALVVTNKIKYNIF